MDAYNTVSISIILGVTEIFSFSVFVGITSSMVLDGWSESAT